MNTTGRSLVTGLAYAVALLLISVLLLSFFLLWTNLNEESLSLFSISIHILALIIGGFVTGKRKGTKGWLNGGMLGICYGLFVLLTGFLAFDASFIISKLLLLLGAFAIGAVGGMLGVQFNK